MGISSAGKIDHDAAGLYGGLIELPLVAQSRSADFHYVIS